jgi:hypothetical protein
MTANVFIRWPDEMPVIVEGGLLVSVARNISVEEPVRERTFKARVMARGFDEAADLAVDHATDIAQDEMIVHDGYSYGLRIDDSEGEGGDEYVDWDESHA